MTSIDVSKIKLFQLRAFLSVANCGSFSGAAASLDLSQSAISHAIASLEEELGVSLFVRGRQGASLTYVGEQIVGEVQQMLQLLDTVIEKANSARGLQTGQVKIATIRSLANYWLPSIISTFNQRFPQVSVVLTKYFDHGEIQAALRDRSADIGLMDIYDRSGLTTTEIGIDEYVVLLPANIPLPRKTISWQQMSQYPFIMPGPNDRGYDQLRDYVATAEVPLTVAYEINEDSTIVSMVAQGLGIAMLPYLAALPIPATVQVCRPPKSLSRLLVAAILDNALYSPAVFVFLDTIKQTNQEITKWAL